MARTREAQITYRPRADATLQTELDAVSAVLRYALFERRASKKGARPGAPEDDVKESNGYVANSNYNK
jgi:hypothetical protein